MADIIDFYAARERLRPMEAPKTVFQSRAFVVVEIPLDVAQSLETSDHPDWISVLDYLIYDHGRTHS